MIADLDETIRQLLRAELPIKNGEIDIKFDQPKREWSARLNKPTINLYLYDVRENHILRQHQWERIKANGNGNTIAEMKRSPFRIDCYYMLTVWASEPEDCHRLLTRCMMVLFRHPILQRSTLQGDLVSQPFDIQARLASHDKLTNPAEVWGALDNEIRPSISYQVTLALDPWQKVEGPAVRSYEVRTGQSTNLPQDQFLDPDAPIRERIYFGGTVRSKGKDKEPQANVDVAVKGTGFMARTDDTGRYRLGGLAPGKYTIIAWPEKGKPVERDVNLPPTADDDFDFEL